jgi:glycosyltransferase involved in cell wall biosynthesis
MDLKPKATMFVLLFNQERFAENAIRSCFGQEGVSLEIIVSDDCSTDGTYEVAKRLVSEYDGNHIVILNRNDKNLGIAGHYNKLVSMASCELMITAAGDDVSFANRAKIITDQWGAADGGIDLISSYCIKVDQDGHSNPKLIEVEDLSKYHSAGDWCRNRPYVIGATHAFTKKLWNEFGRLNNDVVYEDQVMALRAICLGGAKTIKTPLIYYRAGGESSKNTSRGGDRRRQEVAKKYMRQMAVYGQIRADLSRVESDYLWAGKIKRHYLRAQMILKLLDNPEKNINTVWGMRRLLWSCGFFWSLVQLFRFWKAVP